MIIARIFGFLGHFISNNNNANLNIKTKHSVPTVKVVNMPTNQPINFYQLIKL